MTDSALTTAITNIADGTPNTAAEFRTILTELLNRSYKTGDILLLSCPNQYIIDNFDGTGLGIAGRVGWARCNGQNGTRDYESQNRIPIPYGGSYLTMGALVGSQDAVLVAHSHTVSALGDATNNKSLRFGANSDVETELETLTTSTAGVSGINKNIQNSIVTLYIQKINV
jgi:hypothetical protein